MTSVAVPPDGRYGAGRHLDFLVTFDQPVTVTGAPRLEVTLNQGGLRHADYRSGSTTDTLHFRYTITAGVADADGVTLGPAIDLNGGTIMSGDTAIDPTLKNVASLSLVRVGGLLAYEPFLSDGTVKDLTSRTADGSSGFSGDWVLLPSIGSANKTASSVRLMTNSDNMAYPANVSFSLPANDGKVMSTPGWLPTNVARTLQHPISLDENGVVYISFLFRDATPGQDGQALMGFLTGLPTTTTDNSKTAITFGYGYAPVANPRGRIVADVQPANLMAFCEGTALQASTGTCAVTNNGVYTAGTATRFPGESTADGKSWFLVAEITTVPAGNDTIRLKAFRASDSVPATPDQVTWDVTHSSALTGTLTHASIQLESEGGSELDEMRIASSYADVVGLTPAAPGNLSIEYVAGATDATVSATAPSSTGGSAITGYLITATPSGGGAPVSQFSTTPEATFTGLDPTVNYSFSVAAINSDGIGTAAGVDPGAAVAPPTPPGTPTITGVTAGSEQATVSVAPGAGDAPTSYVVTAQPGNRTCTVVTPQTSCVVTGLDNGTSYTFSAVAINDAGSSATSATSAPVTPQIAAPGVPIITGTTSGSGQATVSVAPGAGGAPASYLVTAQPGNHTCTITAPQTSCLLTGLTNGVDYSITVTATNAAGTSAPSASLSARPAAPPVPPAIPDPATGVPSGAPSGSTADSPRTPRPTLRPGQSAMTVDGQLVDHDMVLISPRVLRVRSGAVEVQVTVACTPPCSETTPTTEHGTLDLRSNSTLLVSGRGWMPGTPAEVWLFPEPTLLGIVTVDESGAIDASLAAGTITPGEHTLEIRGMTAAGETAVRFGVRSSGTPLPPPILGQLPAAGGESPVPTDVLILLIALGGLLVLTSRPTARRKAQDSVRGAG